MKGNVLSYWIEPGHQLARLTGYRTWTVTKHNGRASNKDRAPTSRAINHIRSQFSALSTTHVANCGASNNYFIWCTTVDRQFLKNPCCTSEGKQSMSFHQSKLGSYDNALYGSIKHNTDGWWGSWWGLLKLCTHHSLTQEGFKKYIFSKDTKLDAGLPVN